MLPLISNREDIIVKRASERERESRIYLSRNPCEVTRMIRPEEKENEDSKEVVITTVPARLDFVLSTSASPLSLSATATITTTAGGGTSSSSSPPPSSTQLQPQASSYYNKGSTELAVDTPLTLNKLEKVNFEMLNYGSEMQFREMVFSF